jgi:hypothetical protein
MHYEFSWKPRKCPACKSTGIASILYGNPAFYPELEADLEEKRIVLGGCMVTNDDPRWQCTTCDALFCRKIDLDISLPHN